MSRLSCLGFLMMLCTSSYAVQKVEYENVMVVDVATYSNGDIVVRSNGDSGLCEHGFWLSDSEPGAMPVLSNALGSLRSDSLVKIQGDADQRWPGSGGKYCKLIVIRSK